MRLNEERKKWYSKAKIEKKKSVARTTAEANHDKALCAYAVNQQQVNTKSRCDDVP